MRRGAILFRKILKLAAVLAVCLIILVVGVLVNLAGILFPRQRSRACAQVQQMWARMMCCALGMSILSRDAHEQTADGRGMFVVSNHISYLDIIVLAAVFPAAFLSKQEVRRWPLFGWLASLAGTVYVDRAAKRSALAAMEDIEEHLAHGVHVIVFPEGTTSDGCGVLPFKSTFFDLPARLMVPVLPVAVRYLSIDGALLPGDKPSPVAWYGDASLAASLWMVLGFTHIEVRVTCAQSLVAASRTDRKELARQAQARVGEAYWTLLDV